MSISFNSNRMTLNLQNTQEKQTSLLSKTDQGGGKQASEAEFSQVKEKLYASLTNYHEQRKLIPLLSEGDVLDCIQELAENLGPYRHILNRERNPADLQKSKVCFCENVLPILQDVVVSRFFSQIKSYVKGSHIEPLRKIDRQVKVLLSAINYTMQSTAQISSQGLSILPGSQKTSALGDVKPFSVLLCRVQDKLSELFCQLKKLEKKSVVQLCSQVAVVHFGDIQVQGEAEKVKLDEQTDLPALPGKNKGKWTLIGSPDSSPSSRSLQLSFQKKLYRLNLTEGQIFHIRHIFTDLLSYPIDAKRSAASKGNEVSNFIRDMEPAFESKVKRLLTSTPEESSVDVKLFSKKLDAGDVNQQRQLLQSVSSVFRQVMQTMGKRVVGRRFLHREGWKFTNHPSYKHEGQAGGQQLTARKSAIKASQILSETSGQKNAKNTVHYDEMATIFDAENESKVPLEEAIRSKLRTYLNGQDSTEEKTQQHLSSLSINQVARWAVEDILNGLVKKQGTISGRATIESEKKLDETALELIRRESKLLQVQIVFEGILEGCIDYLRLSIAEGDMDANELKIDGIEDYLWTRMNEELEGGTLVDDLTCEQVRSNLIHLFSSYEWRSWFAGNFPYAEYSHNPAPAPWRP